MTHAPWRTITGFGDPNPFVGPRPIQQGEALYGRSTELDELYDRLQARRIVVLHSPSGAGKSSLVQAGLVPKLVKGRYDVWKPIRINLDPRELPGVPEGTNRYLLSALVSLEEELPPARRRSPAQLATLDLLEYLDTRPRRKVHRGRPVVLLFDQFEEVLTLDPRDLEAKREFFCAVGQALDTEKYWALFIIREDYLAALAPYRDRIPTHMANTFRLDLLGLAGAREAAEQLARSQGRSFPGVDQLVRDLSRIDVQQPDGTFVSEQGIHVEPVQLQVVCRRLWDAMPPDDTTIDLEDIAAYGDVSTSLAAYYSDAVRAIASTNTALERSIRDWFGQQLIVGGHRSQVRQGTGSTAGLSGHVIGRLLDTYLVRAEQRAGANWFELSHDRLVEPILEDNDAWERAHLHPLQVQAKLWEDGGRTPALLLGAEMLKLAVPWAEANPTLLTDEERAFLELSRARWAERARQRRRQRIFTASLAGVAAVAVALGAVAAQAKREADEQKYEARKHEWGATLQREKATLQKEEANLQKEEANRQKEEADRQKREANRQKRAALEAQKQNEGLARDTLEQMFDIALGSIIEELGQDDEPCGEIHVDQRWTQLLYHNEQTFIAATIVGDGGRIVAAGSDAILRKVAGHELFVRITTEWLLPETRKAKPVVAIMTHRGGLRGTNRPRKRTARLRKTLRRLGYTVDIDPPLDRLDDVEVLIIDDRYEPFEDREIAAVQDFIRRGRGVLAVGRGSAWKQKDTPYPMNQLLTGMEDGLELQWTRENIEAKVLDASSKARRPTREPDVGPTVIPSTLSRATMDRIRSKVEEKSRECGKKKTFGAKSVNVLFDVNGAGEVTKAVVQGADRSKPFGKCVTDAMLAQDFPRSHGGVVNRNWQLSVEPRRRASDE